ncbi:hypothetical protein D3C74_301280 [compost metagenome]
MTVHGRVVEASREARELGGKDHADRHGRAVAPRVAFGELDRVAQGVAVVEDLAQAGLLEVLPHDARLDRDRAFDELDDDGPRRRGHRGPAPALELVDVLLDELEDPRVGDEAGLDDLGEPGDEVELGQRLERGDVAEHARGRVERAHEVLALGRVDARLAAHGRIHHGQQRRGDVHDLDPAQPGRRDEAREVRRGSPADRDDRVAAREVRLSQDLPQERGDLRGLGLLGVGDLGDVRLVAHREQVLSDRVRRGRERGRVDHEHPADVRPEHRGQLAQEVPADEDVVGLVALHPDAGGRGRPALLVLRCCAHGLLLVGHCSLLVVSARAAEGASPSAVSISWATWPGVRASVRTRSVASRS